MSLLMEALRKAEEAKRRGHTERAPGKGDAETGSGQAVETPQTFSLEEREPVITPAYILDNFISPQSEPEPAEDDSGYADPGTAELHGYLATEPEAEDLTHSPPPPAPRQPVAGAGASAQQLAAASIFSAKRSAPKKQGRTFALAGLLVLVLAGGGGAYWYIASLSSSGLVSSSVNIDLANRGFIGEEPAVAAPVLSEPAALPPPAADAPLQTAATDQQTSAAAIPAEPPAAVPEPEPTPAPSLAEVAVPQQPPAIPQPEQPQPAVAPVATAAPAGLSLPAATPRANLQVSRSSGARQQNPVLQSAYDNLQRGDLQNAMALYQEVLVTAPNNHDALLGMAEAGIRQGDTAAARTWYTRLLQLNPRDPLARTGLLQTIQDIDPLEHENELRALLTQFPDMAPLSFALGNLYAAQQRWSEAQGAYFTALLNAGRSAGPVHPDYAFNLAVSLEQLNQRAAALDYYRQAGELALEITPGFDLELLNSRLTILEQPLP